MGKAVPCRNGCEQYIVVQEDPIDKKWKPYDCDEVGNPLELHNCPKSPYYQQNQQQQQGRRKPAPSSFTSPRVSQGGETLDTKRLLQAVMEISKMIIELKNIVDSRTILDTNKYEQRTNEIYNIIAPILAKDTFKPASKLQRQDIIDNSTTTSKTRPKIIDEVKEIDEDETDEFQRTKKWIDENEDIDDNEEENNDKKIETED